MGSHPDGVRIELKEIGKSDPVIDDPSIGLIRDEIDRSPQFLALLLQQGSQLFKGFTAVNGTGWIIRGVDQDRLCPLADRPFNLFQVQGKVLVRFDQMDHSSVVIIIKLY